MRGMVLAIALALTSCDSGEPKPPADPSKPVTSATLQTELSKVVDEVVASPPATRPNLDRETVLNDLNGSTPSALTVTAGDEAKFAAGDFDDAANTARVKKAEGLLKDFGARTPMVTSHLFQQHAKQNLSGVRLALLAQLAERRMEQVPNEGAKK